jgi:hypothetical protein
MKNYQLNIIKEYVTTALISDDPEEHLINAIVNLIDRYIDSIDEVMEYLSEAELKITLKR